MKYEFQKLVDPPNEAELKLAVPENLDPVPVRIIPKGGLQEVGTQLAEAGRDEVGRATK